MTRFRHKGCTTEIVQFVGSGLPFTGMVMHAKDWRQPDGSPIWTFMPHCPDCGLAVVIGSEHMEPIGFGNGTKEPTGEIL